MLASDPPWTSTNPERAGGLADARLQLHYAAQFCTALGISYLMHEADDSHTNLAWDAGPSALVSRTVAHPKGDVAVGVRAHDLCLLVTQGGAVVAAIPLHGETIPSAADALRAVLATAGFDASRFTLERHYMLPLHPVATGAPFDVTDRTAFTELARWYGNAAVALGGITHTLRNASPARVWPHHFDIATLVSYTGGASIGMGLEPGDTYYDEPYYYVNMHPSPHAGRLSLPIRGGGEWHTQEWVGAVLRGSRITGDAAMQHAQVHEFLDTAFAACRTFVGV